MKKRQIQRLNFGGEHSFLYETEPFNKAGSNCLFTSSLTESTSFNIVSRFFTGVKSVKL